MKQTALWSILVATALVAPRAFADDEATFQHSKELKSSSIKQEELLAVTLDAEVFASTGNGFPDLRLLDGDLRPIPYLLRKVRTTRARTVRETWTGRKPSVRPLADGGLEIIVQLAKKGPRPNGLRILSPLRNFEHRVRVQSSVDGRQWQPAGDETVLFDYSRYMDVRSDSVSFTETPHRHFRIVIDDVTAEQESELLALTRRLRGGEEAERVERVTIDRRPFRIDRIEFLRDVLRDRTTGDKTSEYAIAEFHVEQDSEKQRTLIRVDSHREPLTSLELESPGRNFSRRATVEVRETQGVKSTWREIGAATLSRLEFKKLKREQLLIEFPESRRETYRIVIENRDSPPLEITGIKARGNVYELVFLAVPEKKYQLEYGADEAEQAEYDTVAVEELLREGFDPARAELGEQRAGRGAGLQPEFRWADLLNDSRLLVGTIVLLVVVLGWGLYHAVKRMDNLPSD